MFYLYDCQNLNTSLFFCINVKNAHQQNSYLLRKSYLFSENKKTNQPFCQFWKSGCLRPHTTLAAVIEDGAWSARLQIGLSTSALVELCSVWRVCVNAIRLSFAEIGPRWRWGGGLRSGARSGVRSGQWAGITVRCGDGCDRGWEWSGGNWWHACRVATKKRKTPTSIS